MPQHHRLRVEQGQVMIEPEKKQGFVSGMVSFYGNALVGAKNKLSQMVKNKNQGQRAHFDNTGYG